MAAREVEGVAGKQADGAAKTREAKVIVCREAGSLDPKTGEPLKDKTGRAAGVRIDGVPWIWTVSEEILPAGKTIFILDLYYALEYAAAAAAAVQDAAPDEGKRTAWMERIRKQLEPGGSPWPSPT